MHWNKWGTTWGTSRQTLPTSTLPFISILQIWTKGNLTYWILGLQLNFLGKKDFSDRRWHFPCRSCFPALGIRRQPRAELHWRSKNSMQPADMFCWNYIVFAHTIFHKIQITRQCLNIRFHLENVHFRLLKNLKIWQHVAHTSSWQQLTRAE